MVIRSGPHLITQNLQRLSCGAKKAAVVGNEGLDVLGFPNFVDLDWRLRFWGCYGCILFQIRDRGETAPPSRYELLPEVPANMSVFAFRSKGALVALMKCTNSIRGKKESLPTTLVHPCPELCPTNFGARQADRWISFAAQFNKGGMSKFSNEFRVL